MALLYSHIFKTTGKLLGNIYTNGQEKDFEL